MEPPSKRCKLCYQILPTLPHLPVEMVDRILSYLPFELHVEIVGVNAATRARALRRPDRFVYYFKHDPTVDDAFATHWEIKADDPARPYVGELCRFETPLGAQQFFNKHVPRAAAQSMLNAPRAASDRVLAHRWSWWRLVRALLAHEEARGRGRCPTCVRVADDAWISEAALVTDASVYEFDGQPDAIINVLFDENNITAYTRGDLVYRLI
ncbi:late expression factor 7 [Choristoneura fumiferana DEF multiple nucleopolyhedrovirus]|uniref:Late expression factor 7 n=1 Tax=Choristoneura fumiferana defective polyhedrosis virus TaxID=74660 RepID=Q6VTL9_NPVCD|nr:late expression factor 7 [Choristoneura fumiferana DEF multiple nucleopolyhedrovirus]AAQ91713.1 late expression factor 7 [Choristoneura fumiferana DEF multiple nucleopolyhedrovirus]